MGGEGGRHVAAVVDSLHLSSTSARWTSLLHTARKKYGVPTVVFLSRGVLASCVSTFLISPGQGTLDETVLAAAAHPGLGRTAQGLFSKNPARTLASLWHRLCARLFLLLFGAPRDSRPSGSLPPISAAGILIDLDEHRNDGAAPD